MSNEETLIEFPCSFPIKIMGNSGPQVREAIERALASRASSGVPVDIQSRPSRTGKYIAYTVTCTYESKAELDDMYRAFTSIDGVSMVL